MMATNYSNKQNLEPPPNKSVLLSHLVEEYYFLTICYLNVKYTYHIKT